MGYGFMDTTPKTWEIDKLNRKNDSVFLTDYILARFKEVGEGDDTQSFVLNLNAEWGFGKTYFLENWKEDLRSNGYPVVYFNAWESDFSDEPLLAFISEINSELQSQFRTNKSKKLLADTIEKGKMLIKPSVPLMAAILVKKLTGHSLDQLGDLLEDGSEADESKKEGDDNSSLEEILSAVVSKAAEQSLKNHETTKSSILEFNQ